MDNLVDKLDPTHTYLPLPSHDGIILSSEIVHSYSISEIQKILEQHDLTSKYESLTSDIDIKLLKTSVIDSIWLIRWHRDGNQFRAVVSGTDL